MVCESEAGEESEPKGKREGPQVAGSSFSSWGTWANGVGRLQFGDMTRGHFGIILKDMILTSPSILGEAGRIFLTSSTRSFYGLASTADDTGGVDLLPLPFCDWSAEDVESAYTSLSTACPSRCQKYWIGTPETTMTRLPQVLAWVWCMTCCQLHVHRLWLRNPGHHERQVIEFPCPNGGAHSTAVRSRRDGGSQR